MYRMNDLHYDILMCVTSPYGFCCEIMNFKLCNLDTFRRKNSILNVFLSNRKGINPQDDYCSCGECKEQQTINECYCCREVETMIQMTDAAQNIDKMLAPMRSGMVECWYTKQKY